MRRIAVASLLVPLAACVVTTTAVVPPPEPIPVAAR